MMPSFTVFVTMPHWRKPGPPHVVKDAFDEAEAAEQAWRQASRAPDSARPLVHYDGNHWYVDGALCIVTPGILSYNTITARRSQP